MFMGYRVGEGMLAWLFHRISGVAVWAFVVLHVFDIFLAGAEGVETENIPEDGAGRGDLSHGWQANREGWDTGMAVSLKGRAGLYPSMAVPPSRLLIGGASAHAKARIGRLPSEAY